MRYADRDEDSEEIDNADESTESYKGWTIDDDGMLQPTEVVAQRLHEASEESATRRKHLLPKKKPPPKKVAGQGAMGLTSAVEIALKFVRKVRGIVPEVKMPAPKLGDTNTAWAKAPMTKAAAANHEAAERVSTGKEKKKKFVEDIDNHSVIGRALVGIPEEDE